MTCNCMGPQNGEPLCPCRMKAVKPTGYEFKPDWELPPAENLAVLLSIVMAANVRDWPGATDEELLAAAIDLRELQKTEPA